MGQINVISLSHKTASPSCEVGSCVRSSVKCIHSSLFSSWAEDSESTLVLPFFPSRSFKIIYDKTQGFINLGVPQWSGYIIFHHLWYLLEGCWPFHFRDLSLLPSLDARSSGIQRIMWGWIWLLLTLQHGWHAVGTRSVEWRRRSNCSRVSRNFGIRTTTRLFVHLRAWRVKWMPTCKRQRLGVVELSGLHGLLLFL